MSERKARGVTKMTAIFTFKKGQEVPQWIQSVRSSETGEPVNSVLYFGTRGKLAVIDGDVYIWPARMHFDCIMSVLAGDLIISGHGCDEVGHIWMSSGSVSQGTAAMPSKNIREVAPPEFKNTVKTKPLPAYFDRASTAVGDDYE